MSTTECARWHGAMAMDALGTLPALERAGLLAHLDGCPACREEVRELASTASLLSFVEPAVVDQAASVSPALTGRVLGELNRSATRVRRRRRTGLGLVGVAIAASLVVLAVLAASGPASPSSVRTEPLIGSGSATVTLAARSWGTAVTLAETGHQATGNYTVSMRTASGSWWATGSYHAVSGKVVDAQMTCAVPLSQITGVRVTNSAGTTVLWSESASVPHW